MDAIDLQAKDLQADSQVDLQSNGLAAAGSAVRNARGVEVGATASSLAHREIDPSESATTARESDPLPLAGSETGQAGEPINYDKIGSLPISQWQAADQPRDKLFHLGAARLSDAELVGIVLGSGVRTRSGTLNAVDLARQLLKHFGSLHGLSLRDVREFVLVDGVGPARAAQLAAMIEISRRIEAHPEAPRIQVSSPADVVAIFGPSMRSLHSEVFRIVLLNTANYIIGDRRISEGGLAASIVEPRAVFRHAVLDNAAAIVCLHNHPSGNPEPSREDIRVTAQLADAGRLMGIPVHDHIIVAGKGYTSLAEKGYL